LLGDLCQAMQEVIEIYTPYRLSGEHIKELNQLLYRLVGELLVRCRHRSDHQESEDFDEAQAELYEMENEAEDEFLGKVYGLVNALVKNGKEAYLESFHAELYEIYNAMRKSEDVSLRTNAICVFSQVMEDCPQHPLTRQYCDDLYATCVESVCDEDIPLRQSAVFGIGVCAMVLGTAFASQAEQTMKSLAAIAADESLGDDADVVTDNAISAMAKIFTYVYNSGVSAANVPPCPQSVLQIMSKWVSFLPCDGDVLEAQKIHEQLTQYIGANNPTVLGDGFRNLPIILGVFGKIFGLENWEDVCLPETHAKMVAIFQQLQKEMPIEQLRAMVHEMKPEMKAAYAPYVINQALLQ
jgi:hypothetical protein